MRKMTVLACVIMSLSAFASDPGSKKNDLGFTKEEHMAAEAACKATKVGIRGKELKDCIKTKLGIK